MVITVAGSRGRALKSRADPYFVFRLAKIGEAEKSITGNVSSECEFLPIFLNFTNRSLFWVFQLEKAFHESEAPTLDGPVLFPVVLTFGKQKTFDCDAF